MPARSCVQCSRELADEFRFCPHCGAVQRSKLVEHFRGHPELDDGWLRVSAYLTAPRHLRMSIWRDGEAQAVVSLEPDEARRLGRFLHSIAPPRDSSGLVHYVSARVRRAFAAR
jgi:hypothetical protein